MPHRLEDCDVALVINDPVAANQIAVRGLPVVYVDSLPYLWTTDAEIPEPKNVAHYCAQKYPMDRLPVGSSLRNWPDIHWIDPIVPISKGRRGGRGIVINVGGLHSHLVEASVDAYLNLVLFPLVEFVKTDRRIISAVCGNLGADTCASIAALLPECPTIGPQTPYDFEQILRNADLLITSPGSTTILQAISIKLPTLLLPPQNLSQIFNSELYADRSAGVMHWPTSVLNRVAIEQLRPQGEDAVLTYIYQAITDAVSSTRSATEVSSIIENGVRQAPPLGY